MQLTSVLALLFTSQAVFCAPAALHTAEVAASKVEPSDTLEFELRKAQDGQPITAQNVNEADKAPVNGPEVKRSERVDTGDEADLSDLSSNLKAADEEVKVVLRTFFQNLKKHPEIVEEILEREGAKLMEQPLEEEPRDTMPIDMNSIQQPSPQLDESPKQVEKKTGGYPDYPRFIYKSPMRNAKERNLMTSQSINNPDRVNNVLETGSQKTAPAYDLTNAIPVIQQPSTQEAEDDQVEELMNSPKEGGNDDLNALQQEQEEYSQRHPFINPLPIFPGNPSHNPAKPELEPEIADEQEVAESEQEEAESGEENGGLSENLSNELSVEDKRSDSQSQSHDETEEEEINEANELAEEETEETHPAESESEESEENHAAENESEESEEAKATESDENKWSETQVDESSPNAKDPESHLVAETSNKATKNRFLPYDYIYYYGDDGNKFGDELDVKEEGDNNEEELENVSEEVEEEEKPQETEEESESHEESKVSDESNEDELTEEETEMKRSDEENDDTTNEDHEEQLEEMSHVDEPSQTSKAVGYAEGGVVVPPSLAQDVDKNEADLLSLDTDGRV